MEKLLELLNEHRVELAHGNLQNQLMRHYNGYVFGLGDLNSQNCVLLIISKQYGFIKWLVENEKIDYEKIEKQTKCKNIVGGKEFLDFDIERDFTPYEEVLMWLAIQDEPIEFLVSILK